jgi:hypothetical protein
MTPNSRIHQWSFVILSLFEGHQSDLVVSKLDSQSKGCGFKSRLIQNTRWKWGQSHARIHSRTQFWFAVEKNKKNTGSQMGHTKINSLFFRIQSIQINIIL